MHNRGGGVDLRSWHSVGVSLFIGVQILLAGIALVIVSFARKELVDKIMDRARHMSPDSYP